VAEAGLEVRSGNVLERYVVGADRLHQPVRVDLLRIAVVRSKRLLAPILHYFEEMKISAM
jgi:hypothetical protein